MHNTHYTLPRMLCGVVKYHADLLVMQSQISKQDSQIKSLQAERSSLAAQMEDMQGNLQIATSLADQQVSLILSLLCHVSAPTYFPAYLAQIVVMSLLLRLAAQTSFLDALRLMPAVCVQGAQAQEVQVDEQAHAEQMHQLQAAHEEELVRVQQAAQLAQADMQAAHAAESSSIKEAHAADLNRLRALQDALPERLMQLQAAEPRQSSDMSPRQIGACR